MDQYKITAEEFARVSIARLATHPNSRSGVGEGGMRDTDLKKRFDAQGELFRKKFNALLVTFSMMGEGSLAASMPTGIKEEHTLWDMICDVVSERGTFASYLSVGERSLLEALSDMAERDDDQEKDLEQFIQKHNADIASVVAQMDEAFLRFEKDLAERVVRVGTQEPALYLTDGMDGEGRGTVPVAEEARGGAVALRDALGALFVGAAAEGGHAVNLSALRAVVETLVAKVGDQAIDGDLSISGNLYVAGKTHGIEAETLRVRDAVIVANADGEVLAELAGYVIRVGGERAYGIMYNPAEDCVKIGLGRLEGQLFIYDEGEAQVLATRGEIADGNVPMWDGALHQFVDGMMPMAEVANKEFVRRYFADVYDKGYDDGYAAAEAAYGNALYGVVSGNGAVQIPDVSPLMHTIKAKCGGDNVVRYGKNLLTFPYSESSKTMNGVTFTVNDDGTVLVNGTATDKATFFLYAASSMEQLISNKDIDVYESGCPAGGGEKTFYIFDSWIGLKDVGNGFASTKNIYRTKAIQIVVESGVTMDNVVFKPQLEVGTKKTEYEPYVEPIEVAAVDGAAEVPSLYPTTTIIGEGALEAAYNRDINKAYTELVNAIIALGGAMNV